MRHALLCIAVSLGLAGAARAETDREKAAREIDEQMKRLVKPLPPPQARVIWEGLDSDKIAIDEARFELDDAKLAYGDVDQLLTAAKNHKTIYDGPVDPGKHQLNVSLAIHRTRVSLLEGLRTTTFKVSSGAAFPGQPGLEVTLRIKLHYDETIADPKKRLKLETRMESKMMANVDDAPMPEPARTIVAEGKPAEAKPEPVAEKSQPKPEAVADEPPAHGKKGKKAKPEKPGRRQHLPPVVAEAEPVPVATHVVPPAPVAVDAGAPAVDAGPIDAGPIDAGPVDAGVMVAAAVDAGPPAPAAPAATNGVLWAGIGAGVVVFVIVLALMMRQRKRGF